MGIEIDILSSQDSDSASVAPVIGAVFLLLQPFHSLGMYVTETPGSRLCFSFLVAFFIYQGTFSGKYTTIPWYV